MDHVYKHVSDNSKKYMPVNNFGILSVIVYNLLQLMVRLRLQPTLAYVELFTKSKVYYPSLS